MKLSVKKFKELTAEELYDIIKLRNAVFVVEQNCVYQDLDGKDKNAFHVTLSDDEGIQAYLRVLDGGVSYKEPSLGRIISAKRRMGLGTAVVKAGIEVAKEKYGASLIRISAQVQAMPFYESLGFTAVSEVYDEDGIPHREMTLAL
ncbi:MAG: GNAT family N-acetyltransferase [Ruminococcaceae bacterium]|nr:GNAT family N-acetyltransferase [Oscillospiraceae bacterium]